LNLSLPHRYVLAGLALAAVSPLAAAASGTTAMAAEDASVQVLSNPDLYYLDHFDVSPPLRDMPVIPPSATERPREINTENTRRIGPLAPAPPGWVDPLEAQSKRPAPELGVTTGLNFVGVGRGLGTYSPSVAPPDTNGAVGATQYVQWVNLHFAVFNKTTGALVYGPAAGNSLWQGFGGTCETYNSGDPIVAYDKAASRWVMTQFAFASSTGGPWYQCVAVSTTSDATGSYRRFAYNFTALNDYPKLGVWPDGYYVTFNMFYGNLSGGRTCVMDRNNMISASGTPGAIQCFQISSYWSLLPADLDGTTAPPSGAPNYQLNFGTNSLRLWKYKVNWATPSLSTLTGPTAIAVASFSTAGSIPQSGTTQTLDSLSDRLMHRLAYRNRGSYETLVVTHSVAAGTAASGVRWYEIRNPNGTPTVYQQGTFSPDSTARWMGSIAMDKDGNMAVGYSASSSSIYPAIRYTGRLATDALGTMQAENTLVNGGGSQTAGLSRWGDYSSMTVDPVDDCTFWYTTEYLQTSGTWNWSTRIGSFKFASCGTPPDFSIACSPSSLTLPRSQSRSTTCTVTSVGGFSSAVTLSCANLPSGVSCSPSPNPVTPPANGSANSTVTFTATSSATLGTFSVQVNGTGSGLTRTANITLTVNDPLVVGITADYNQATCTASGGTPGYTYYWYVTPTYCDPCLPLESGEPDVCCLAAREGRELPPPCPIQAPRPNNICPEEGPYTSSPANQWFWNGTEASIRCSATDAASATAFSSSITRPAPPPNFTLSCSPTSLTISPGGSGTTTCTVTSQYGFASPVTLSCTNLPSGVTCSPNPNPVTPPAYGSVNSSVTFSVSSGTALGSYSVQVSGTGGGLTRTAGVTLNVSNAPLSATLSVVNWVATCNASGGTPPYTYRWYVRYLCDPCLIAQKERIARGESPDALPCPFNTPDSEAICPWEGPYTSSPPNQWQLYGDETGVRCNVIDAVGASVTVTQFL
jgi:hypothetical protein